MAIAQQLKRHLELSPLDMKQQILAKLGAVLSVGVDSEYKVVYILSATRKLLESYPIDPVPFALKLYCHWALHVDLTHPKVTLPFLERVDSFVVGFLAGQTYTINEHRMMREFIFLDTFRGQFREFLEGYSLPSTVCDEDQHWHEFLKHYSGIIEDGSLSCEDKTQRLKIVRKVIFSKSQRRASDTYIPFDLAWDIVLSDGRILRVEVNAAPLPDGNQVVLHGIHLK